jgi:hypothetical protein
VGEGVEVRGAQARARTRARARARAQAGPAGGQRQPLPWPRPAGPQGSRELQAVARQQRARLALGHGGQALLGAAGGGGAGQARVGERRAHGNTVGDTALVKAAGEAQRQKRVKTWSS